MTPIVVRAGDAAIVVAVDAGVPEIVGWGSARGDDLTVAVDAARPLPGRGGLDVVAPLTLVPEHGSGFDRRPGLRGRRADGTAWAPRFVLDGVVADGERSVTVRAVDEVARLRLDSEMTTAVDGVFTVAVTLHNDGDSAYLLDELSVSLLLPRHAAEVLTLHGRWCREFVPHRAPIDEATTIVESWAGRTSHWSAPVLWAGTAGFSETVGEVWAASLAWSGNHRLAAERLGDGRVRLALGEQLHPGEVDLAPGESYRTPDVVVAHSPSGLQPTSRAFHRYVRATSPLATRTTPRPVTLNVWEAVYFDHDAERLRALAEAAAEIGVERYVLDDGWFGGRRDDRRGLGDWWVSPDAHPDGLAPLIDHVRAQGMEFGIWIEPEMINRDSELYRTHPDWVAAVPGYEPVTGRQQLVVDLSNPAAYAEIFGRLDALLADHDISYVKWDMNRDHVHVADGHGRAASRAQTMAVYRLLDELRGAHPDVEFESCASGGGRIDHGILRRVERVWTSDCNDALERQVIQRGATMFVPPEMLGAHVGPSPAHTTGRRHSVDFRAATALFGHFGIEWDLLSASADDRRRLAWWIERYTQLRPLLHSGDVVRLDAGDAGEGAAFAHGVIATDRRRAVIARVQLTTAAALAPPPLRVPGLDPDARFRVALLLPDDAAAETTGHPRSDAASLTTGVELSGRQLADHGVRVPEQAPESAYVYTIEAVR